MLNLSSLIVTYFLPCVKLYAEHANDSSFDTLNLKMLLVFPLDAYNEGEKAE